MSDLAALLERVRACAVCAAHLPHGVRPVLRASATARLLIVGQAPGARVHATGIFVSYEYYLLANPRPFGTGGARADAAHQGVFCRSMRTKQSTGIRR
ncbi:hypothetical protein [Azospirillum sp. sgz301742]